MAQRNQPAKPSLRRGEMAFVFAIVLGLIVGILIKRVRIGIVLGMVLGGIIVLLGWTRMNKR